MNRISDSHSVHYSIGTMLNKNGVNNGHSE